MGRIWDVAGVAVWLLRSGVGHCVGESRGSDYGIKVVRDRVGVRIRFGQSWGWGWN